MTAQKTRTFTGVLLTLFLVFCISTRLAWAPIYTRMSTTSIMWWSRIACWVAVLIIYLYARNIEREKLLPWGNKKSNFIFFILSVVAILLALIVASVAISLIEKVIRVPHDSKVMDRIVAAMCGNKPLLLFTCLTAAVTEELMFRGYLMPRLQVLSGKPWLSIVFSSLLFGLAHFGYHDFNHMFFPFIIGLVFAIHYYKYRNLAILITCHFLIDFISLCSACSR